MRILDILSETKINKAQYIPAVNTLLQKNGINMPLEKKSGVYINFYPEPNQQVANLDDLIKGKLDDGTVVSKPVKNLYKSDAVHNLYKGKKEGTRKINKGEIVEGYHAAAAFARLVKRPLESINFNDMMSIINQLENGQTLILKGKEVQSKIADRFELTIRLKPASWEAFKDPKTAPLMGELLTSIITDANEETSRFAERFATNQKYDVARVVGDGVTDEDTKKTDVSFENEAEKKFAGYSIKATTTKQVHQVGGGAVADSPKQKKATPEERFNILAHNLFAVDGKFPLANIDSAKSSFLKAKTLQEQQQIAYQAATQSLNQNLQSDDQEKQFLKNLTGAMKYWMGKDDPSIKLKQFTTAGTSILDPQKIDSLIDKDQIDLIAQYVILTDNLPKIIISDAVSGKSLVSIRTKKENRDDGNIYIRNYIEKEELWVDLTTIKNIANVKVKPVRSTANKPVATDPKPALDISKQQMGQDSQDATDYRFSGE
jgi:hypothetical protein